MGQDFIQSRMRRFRRKVFLLAGGFLAVFFLIFELISAASNAVVILTYYNQAKQECSNMSSSDDDGDGDVSVGSYDDNIESMAYAVAKAMEKAYGYKAELVFAQLGHETGFKAGYTNATKNFNLAGIKYTASMSDYAKPGESVGDGTGGVYAKFKSLDAFATVYYEQYLKPDFGKTKPKTVQEWAHLLKQHGYYTAPEDNYVAGMSSFLDEYKKYEAAHKNDSKKDSSSSSKKKTSTAKKKTAAVVHSQKKTLNDLIVDVDKPSGAFGMNDLVKKENDKSTINETAKEDAKSASKVSSASSSKTSSKATQSSKVSSKTFSKKDDSKSSSSEKYDSEDDSSDDDSKSDNSLGMTEDSCKAMGFDTEDDESSGEWAYPFKGMTYKSAKAQMSSDQAFGVHSGSGRTNNYHDGVDFGTAQHNGQAIRAIHGGKVIDIGFKGTTQNDIGGYVVTKSSDGWYIVYQEFVFSPAESDVIKVKKGETVEAGETIGILSTSTANVNHVHIGATKKNWANAISDSFSSAGGWKDPLELIKKGIAESKKSGGSSGSGIFKNLSKEENAARLWIRDKESGGNYKAKNPGNPTVYGAYQLKRSYLAKGSKEGGDGTMSKANQDLVAQNYMKERYGTWVKAKKFWEANNWW